MSDWINVDEPADLAQAGHFLYSGTVLLCELGSSGEGCPTKRPRDSNSESGAFCFARKNICYESRTNGG